jgi:hypothetical protein
VCVVTDQPGCVVEVNIGQRYPLGQRNVGAMQPCVHQWCRSWCKLRHIHRPDATRPGGVQSRCRFPPNGFIFVGAEPFNAGQPQEMQTVNNNNPSLALQRLDVRVYDLTGSPASISTAFYFVLRMKERQA